MKLNRFIILKLLVASLGVTHATSYGQTPANTDYGSLIDIIPVIAKIKANPTANLIVPIGWVSPVPVPSTPSPTHPIPITTAPSAPGKFAMVRWLLPGGPPPPAPNLPPLECTIHTCPND